MGIVVSCKPLQRRSNRLLYFKFFFAKKLNNTSQSNLIKNFKRIIDRDKVGIH
jgi:hypothetical protein